MHSDEDHVAAEANGVQGHLARDPKYAEYLRVAYDEAFDCFATAKIFARRQRVLTLKTRVLDFVALGVPVVLGGGALAFWPLPEWAVVVASSVLLVQLLLALWAMVASWTQKLSIASECAASNQHLGVRYQRLHKSPPPTTEELKQELDKLLGESDQRIRADSKEGAAEWEERRGHRAALRQFKEKCPSCKEIPQSMESTDCGVCGQFALKDRLKMKG